MATHFSMTRDEAQQLTKRILSFATVREIQVSVVAGRRSHLRFARNSPTTSGTSDSTAITVIVWKGKRKASASATLSARGGSADSALRALVAEAETLAALSPEDPEYMPLLGPQEYLEVKAYDAETAEMPAAARAKAVGEALAVARRKQLVAAGILRNYGVYHALANSAGLFAYFPSSTASFSITARTADGSGSSYAETSSVSMKSVDCRETMAIAVKRAMDSRGARDLPPGDYPAILEPQALADMATSLLFALNARPADEGRSVFSAPGGKTRIGERIFDPRVNIYTDPQHSVVPASSFSGDGFPTAKAYLARNGVLENLSHTRYWAKQRGRPPGPFFVNLIMDGEGKPISEMIASMERGILLTRLWYLRMVDPQQALVTGLTRDGTFYIEGGKIQHPVKNFRFNESLVRLRGQVELLGTPQRVMQSENISFGDGGMRMMLPAMKVRSFRFTSVSDAV